MKHWSARQILAVLLAVFVTVGMTFSAVQASDMTAKMAMAANMGTHGDCQGCPAGGDDDGGTPPCPSGCMTPILALVPDAVNVLVAAAWRFQPPRHPLLSGRGPWPDPYPPRPSDLG